MKESQKQKIVSVNIKEVGYGFVEFLVPEDMELTDEKLKELVDEEIELGNMMIGKSEIEIQNHTIVKAK